MTLENTVMRIKRIITELNIHDIGNIIRVQAGISSSQIVFAKWLKI